MTIIIALVHCLESFNAAVHGCMRIQVEPSNFSDLRRWSWEFRKANATIHRATYYRGECYTEEEFRKYDDVPSKTSAEY